MFAETPEACLTLVACSSIHALLAIALSIIIVAVAILCPLWVASTLIATSARFVAIVCRGTSVAIGAHNFGLAFALSCLVVAIL